MNAYNRAISKAQNSGKTVRRKTNYEDFPFSRYNWHLYENDADAQHDYYNHARSVVLDGYWLYKSPQWWKHIKQTIPDRAKERNLCKNILKIVDLECYPIFPDGRRRCHYW